MIKRCSGTITEVVALSESARHVTLSVADKLSPKPGSFVNLFMDVDGVKVRRAFSIVSANETGKTISLAIRLSQNGQLTPQFWKPEILGTPVDVMGPLGVNTYDKLTRKNLMLFGFGIGAGVICSLAEAALNDERKESVTIITGSRNEDDILYRTWFDALAQKSQKVMVRYVLSKPKAPHPFTGHIQEHINDLSFENADVYMCGQVAACDALRTAIESKKPSNVAFFTEAFH